MFLHFFNLTISSRSALLLASISIHVNTLTQFKDSDYQYQLNIQVFSHRSCIYETAHRHYISNQITDADHQQTFLQLSRRSYTQFKGTHSLTRNRNAVLFTKQIIWIAALTYHKFCPLKPIAKDSDLEQDSYTCVLIQTGIITFSWIYTHFWMF